MEKYTSTELVKEILEKVTGKEIQIDNTVNPKELYEILKNKQQINS